MSNEITSNNEMHPFTAARIQNLSDADRSDELKRIGLKFLRANNLMRWDGFDIEFATDIADRFYRAALAKIGRAASHIKTAA